MNIPIQREKTVVSKTVVQEVIFKDRLKVNSLFTTFTQNLNPHIVTYNIILGAIVQVRYD